MGERKYSETHEWVSVEGPTATIGITDYAQAQLGDVVFLELPRKGQRIKAGESFGVIESVKAASDLYAPVDGTIVEVNEELATHPELINSDPLGAGWLVKVEAEKVPDGLLDEAGYKQFTEGAH